MLAGSQEPLTTPQAPADLHEIKAVRFARIAKPQPVKRTNSTPPTLLKASSLPFFFPLFSHSFN